MDAHLLPKAAANLGEACFDAIVLIGRRFCRIPQPVPINLIAIILNHIVFDKSFISFDGQASNFCTVDQFYVFAIELKDRHYISRSCILNTREFSILLHDILKFLWVSLLNKSVLYLLVL